MIKFIKEVVEIMAIIYATLILKGKKRLSDVPAIIRADVEEVLKEMLEVEELPQELL